MSEGRDFFDNRFAGRIIAARPLPFFVKPNAVVGECHRRGFADAGHKFAFCVDVVITHVERALVVAVCDEMAGRDLAAAVVGPDDAAFLVVIKNGFGPDLAGRRILHRSEFFAVVIYVQYFKRKDAEVFRLILSILFKFAISYRSHFFTNQVKRESLSQEMIVKFLCIFARLGFALYP